jgi:Domain of unknown function (DUF4288)
VTLYFASLEGKSMPWFAAHMIESIRPIRRDKGEIFAYENVILIEAKDSDEARVKAKKYGEASVADDNPLTIDDEPAEDVFVGIRKIIEIREPIDSGSNELLDGAEITRSKMRVKNEEALAKLASGEEVALAYLE